MTAPDAPVVLVHGGAGDVPDALRDDHAEACRRAADAGLAELLATGSALDAVVRAVACLEDDSRFNAGRGAALDARGELSLDAAVMEGTSLRAGAVCALPAFANPVRVALAVLRDGRHVLYAGEGAARFAEAHGFARLPAEALVTEAARARLAAVLAGRSERGWAGGTVGAVACDGRGHVAAATSTGGLVGKAPGRVGDSPIPGAGTFAEDETGAISATGDGDAALRFGLARAVAETLRAGVPAQAAAEAVLLRFGSRVGGSGGLVLVTPSGDIGIAKNTATMGFGLARAGAPSRGGC